MAAAVQRGDVVDVEAQPQPPPGAPRLLPPSAAAPVRWAAGDEGCGGPPEQWEAQWGYPLLGGWEDLPCTADATVQHEEGMLWMLVSADPAGHWVGAVRGLEGDQRYVFRIRGRNEAGEGPWSATSPAVTTAPDGSVAAAASGGAAESAAPLLSG